jgi:L-asparaginase / beta-aspartyl-peptidase
MFKMKKVAIAVHGGAGNDSAFIRENKSQYEAGLKEAVLEAYSVLKTGGSALDAVSIAVASLEDNPFFNAGRGSALNCNGEVEMDASIMNGADLKAGAIAMVRNIKNPVKLARAVMENTSHVLLAGYGALEFAKGIGMSLRKMLIL